MAVREAAGVREWIVASRLVVGVTALAAVAALTTACTDREPGRDPLSWPFASTSIWNMPIGTSADYVSADLPDVPGGDEWSPMPGLDAEYLLLDPDAPLTKLYYNGVGWDGGDRCKPGSDILATVPVPNDYTVPNNNHNNGAVFLLGDHRTILQSQPFTRCEAGGPATSLLTFPEQDLYGDGISGAHGGSRLSSLGGSLRLGELRPGQQGPRHALKLNVYGRQAFYRCQTKDQCWTWPASNADSHAVGNYGVDNDNQNTAMKMGALLAIPASTNLGSLGLETEPASQLAWTLQNYGAYIVDDTSLTGLRIQRGNRSPRLVQPAICGRLWLPLRSARPGQHALDPRHATHRPGAARRGEQLPDKHRWGRGATAAIGTPHRLMPTPNSPLKDPRRLRDSHNAAAGGRRSDQ